MSIAGPSLMPWPERVRRAFPVVLVGLGVAGMTAPVLMTSAAKRALRGGGPGLLGVGAAGTVSAVIAGRAVRRRFVRRLRDGARGLDAGFSQAPNSPLVSGGPGSHVGSSSVGREGARYVGSVTNDDDVTFVTGAPAKTAPIRIFVGLDAADSVEQRVGLAIAELRRTQAFERSSLLIQSPAGTGYANPTPVDVLELLSRGDCASVAVGYGLLPSFLSMNRVAIARRTQELLLEAIAAECALRDSSPRLLLYGESLGARVQQAALPDGVADLDRLGIDTAVWVGTPGGRGYDITHEAFAQVAVTIDNPAQIPERLAQCPGQHPRVWFLEHDGDPVVRFRRELLHRRPEWLPPAGRRGRGIPQDMRWMPLVTWAQVLVDTVYATDVTPGDFRSEGHDYRADLGQVITQAYRLNAPAKAGRLEERLREIEIRRAARIEGAAPGAATLETAPSA